MDLLIILTYVGVCVAAFKIFKIPLNKWTVPTAALGGIALLSTLLLLMNYNHAYAKYGRDVFVSIPIVPEVSGQVIAVEVEDNSRVRQGDVLFRLDPVPFELDEVLAAAVDPPTLEVLPDTGLPRNLLRRRPDVRRQERLLAAQTARIGVAQADLYPRFNLLGFLGLSTITFGDLADGDSGTWRLGLPVTWNIFSGGRLRARVAQEEARTRAALLTYQETVLAAVTEVETTIASAAKLYEFRTTLQRALAATRESAVLVQKQYEAGVLDFQRVIDVERTLLLQEDQLAVVNGDLVNSLVRLYRALGGGWSPEGDPLLVPPSTSG